MRCGCLNVGAQAPGSGALSLRHSQQMPSDHEQVGQGTGDEQPMGVLGQSPVTYLCKAKNPLDDTDNMFNLGAHAGFSTVGGPLVCRQRTVPGCFLLGEVAGLRRALTDNIPLSGISRIAPHARLLAVQQIDEPLTVMHVGRRGHDREEIRQ